MTKKELLQMDYWELRKVVSKLVPRTFRLREDARKGEAVKEKGRKKNYHQYDLVGQEMTKRERLLNTEEVNSFLEISCRAQACPMPLNLDVYDGLLCGFKCLYCYADAFRASLYTSFFDNSKSVGLRHCNPDFYKAKLDDLFNKSLGKDPLEIKSDVGKALAKRIPIRFGIRFEDFLPAEKSKGISLELLNYLRKAQYPLMINTKSNLVGEDAYVKALSGNKAKTAVHITMISCDEDFLRVIEPGAPTFEKRIQAAKNLVDAGVRAVARIEPYMVFLNDSQDMVQEYFGRMKEAGVTHLTFDTYSYSANNPGIRQNFVRRGYDWERMFLLTSDSQAIGSLLLSKFMEMFREQGFSASSFDMGGVPDNNDPICCSVGDWFKDAGYNWGCVVGAVRYIKERGLKPTSWNNFHRYVMRNGGFLSKVLEEEVKELWNLEGNASYFVNWGRGIEPCGHDEHGILWHYRENPEADFRYKVLEGVV